MKAITQIRKTVVIVIMMTLVSASCNPYRYVYDDGGAKEPERLGRPVLGSKTIYTAWGTPLRGTSVAAYAYYDENDVMRSDLLRKQDYEYLMKSGINTLQLKLEDSGEGKPVGHRVESCDRIVDECEQLGLYVIICITVMSSENFDSDMKYINEFWEFYAPRYKDRKHVIYEIANEFGRFDESEDTGGFQALIEGQASAYRTIRKHAPDTPVILWSFSDTIWETDMKRRMTELNKQIAGGLKHVVVGVHSYECGQDGEPEHYFAHFGPEGFRNVVQMFNSVGYPVMNTEVPARQGTQYIAEQLFRVVEDEGVSWISSHFDLLALPSHWRGGFEAAGIAWTPDYGDWPRPDAHCPFNTSFGGGIGLFGDLTTTVATISKLNFGTRTPLWFLAEAEADGEGTLEIRLPDGTVVGSCPIAPGIDSVRIPIVKPLEGITDLTFVYLLEQASLLRLRNWRFELPQRAAYQKIFDRVHFADYPYHSGAVERGHSSDPASGAPLTLRHIRHGSSITYDFITFDRRAVNTLHLRARTLAGGIIRAVAGRNIAYPFGIFIELGQGEINGARGEWTDFVIPVNLNNDRLCSEPWDLTFIFESTSGSGTQELFELSEFGFK